VLGQSWPKKALMPQGEKQGRRVRFEHPIPAQIMAIDGTWRRPCSLKEVSETGATRVVGGSIQDLARKEFFLLLSSRCGWRAKPMCFIAGGSPFRDRRRRCATIREASLSL
jgi:hypothetical protein